jgi:hypothetical protein
MRSRRRVSRRNAHGTPLGTDARRKETHMSTAARIGIGVVLLAFADLNVYVLWQYGLVGFWQLVTANTATMAALVDLTIALSLVTVWMWRDARRRGVTLLPYLALTATLGSIGPLLYLVVHGREAKLA